MSIRQLFSAVACAVPCLVSNPANATNTETGTSTWLWSPASIISTSKTITSADTLKVQELIAFCQEKGVTKIYLHINPEIEIAKYQYLVASLKAVTTLDENKRNAIKVHALEGADSSMSVDREAQKDVSLNGCRRIRRPQIRISIFQGFIWMQTQKFPMGGLIPSQNRILYSHTMFSSQAGCRQKNEGDSLIFYFHLRF